MKPINTVVSISLASAKQTAATPAAKAVTTSAEGAKEFSSLLESLVSHAHSEGDQEKALPKELLEKVEVMLTTLQEQPVEDLTAAQQEILYELIQLFNSQPEKKDGVNLVDTGKGKKITPILPDVESQPVSKEVQAKLAELFKKLSDLVPAISVADAKNVTDTKQFAPALELMGVEEKKTALPVEKIEKIFNKILEFTETMADSGKKVTAAAVQPEQQAAKTMVLLAAETDKHLKVSGETKTEEPQEVESVKAPQTTAVIPAGRNDREQQQEDPQQEDKQSLMSTPVSADSNKPASVPAQTTQPVQITQPVLIKPEQPVMPSAVVRMDNMTEELGEIFKNSMRLSANNESTQIKVNISPENLGHLDIRLTETNGRIAAQIFTSSIAAKEVLDLQLNQLRNTLTQQGLTIDRIEISQHSSQQSLGQQNAQSEQRFFQQQRQKSGGRDNKSYQQLEEKAAIERSHLDTGMMKVDYTV